MELRPITQKDLNLLDLFSYSSMSETEKSEIIKCSVNRLNADRYFELFLVFQNNKCIGIVNVAERTDCIVTCIPAIVESERHKGYGFETLIAILSLMFEKGYTIAVADVAADNSAGIKLHEKLGFERERTYKDGDNDCYLYIRTLAEFGEI